MLLAERWVKARLRNQTFFSLDKLNAAISPRAARIGPHVATFVTLLMEKRRHPEQAYRACLSVLKLRTQLRQWPP